MPDGRTQTGAHSQTLLFLDKNIKREGSPVTFNGENPFTKIEALKGDHGAI